MSTSTQREKRISRELALLERLQRGSSIFDFQVQEGSAGQFMFTFNGKGVLLDPDANAQVEEDSVSDPITMTDAGAADLQAMIDDVHRVEVILPDNFPAQAPDIRWKTRQLHPNVPFSGLADPGELGLRWQTEMTLDVLCDRLWDVIRLAWVDLSAATNHAARRWYEQDCTFKLPVDARPLRNRALTQPQNVVSYRRIDRIDPPPASLTRELLFIGDEPPTGTIVESEQEDANQPATDDQGILFLN